MSPIPGSLAGYWGGPPKPATPPSRRGARRRRDRGRPAAYVERSNSLRPRPRCGRHPKAQPQLDFLPLLGPELHADDAAQECPTDTNQPDADGPKIREI